MNAVLSFAAALLALRLTGDLVGRWRSTRAPELAAWAGALAAYALASAALAWGAAHGWDGRAFRAYYCFGGLLTAPLLGAGSLLRVGRRSAGPLALLYAGLAVGVAVAAPLHGHFAGTGIPAAQDHLAFLPGRLVAVAGNVVGTVAAVGVALWTLRDRPLQNALLLAGIAVAAGGSAASGLGESGTALFIALAALLLYAGFVGPAGVKRLLGMTARRRFPA